MIFNVLQFFASTSTNTTMRHSEGTTKRQYQKRFRTNKKIDAAPTKDDAAQTKVDAARTKDDRTNKFISRTAGKFIDLTGPDKFFFPNWGILYHEITKTLLFWKIEILK